MPQTKEVKDFLSSIGPFYDTAEVEKEEGEEEEEEEEEGEEREEEKECKHVSPAADLSLTDAHSVADPSFSESPPVQPLTNHIDGSFGAADSSPGTTTGGSTAKPVP